jgi:hypothetical protein
MLGSSLYLLIRFVLVLASHPFLFPLISHSKKKKKNPSQVIRLIICSNHVLNFEFLWHQISWGHELQDLTLYKNYNPV